MYNLQVQLHKCNCKLICKKISLTSTAWKVSKYGVFSDPYFPVCGLYTEIYSVNLCILSKYEKIRARKTPYSATFNTVMAVSAIDMKHRVSAVQKQPFRDVLRKRCSENIQQIYWRTPMPKCNFNRVAKQLYWNCTSAWVFSCKFVAYFQNNFLREHVWRATSGSFWKITDCSLLAVDLY